MKYKICTLPMCEQYITSQNVGKNLNVTLLLLKHPVSECYGIGDENEMSKTVSFNRPHDVCTK